MSNQTEPEVLPEDQWEQQTAAMPSMNGQGNLSLLNHLKDQRERIAEEHTLDVVVPGYDGLLGLRLGPIPMRTLSQMIERSQRSKSPDKDANLQADQVIRACRCVVVRRNADDPWEPLDQGDGVPIVLDSTLASLFDMPPDVKTSRAVLFWLFRLANSPDVAIMAINAEWTQWAREAEQDVEETFQGESEAAARSR